MLCPRCGGIIAEKQTKVVMEDNKTYHYYCSFKIWQEQKEKREQEWQERKNANKI